MPPLEDELRAALQGRAATLTPAADPFAGVEQRARGLRRRRTAASVAGSALAVLAVVGVVPLLTTGGGSTPGVVATSAPTTAPSSYALDLDDPWEYRGDRDVLGDGNLETWQRDWAAARDGAELVPLFGQVWEPSGQPELVFVSRTADPGRLEYGVATTSESGPEFRVAERDAGATSFPVVLPGDERGQRLLLVASPEVARLQYAPDGQQFEDLRLLAPGVATVAVDPELNGLTDQFQVVGPRGELVETGAVDDEAATSTQQQAEDAGAAAAPDNVVDWPVRGPAVDQEPLQAAKQAYARSRGADASAVREKVLVSAVDQDLPYLLGQFWLEGDEQADTFGVVVRGEQVEPQLKEPLDPEADLVVLALTSEGEAGTRLVVVTRPDAVRLDYRPSAERGLVRVELRDPQAVSTFDRAPAAERPDGPADGLTVAFPDGTSRSYPVASLLCGKTSCS